jgi:cytochrome c-type biogenesis protein
MDGENLSLLIAFAAGVLSFASPCCLPLVPAYLGHMVTVSGERPESAPRLVNFTHASAFVMGFSLIFIGFWSLLGLVGYVVIDNAHYMREIGGAILVFMGLHLLGVINLGFMNREYTVSVKESANPGYGRSLVLGMTFAAGWTPCIGPILGSIIGLSVIEGDAAKGALFLAAYSAGLGVPFLAMAIALGPISALLRRARPLLAAVPAVSGALVVTVGLLMLTNNFFRISQFFNWGGDWSY